MSRHLISSSSTTSNNNSINTSINNSASRQKQNNTANNNKTNQQLQKQPHHQLKTSKQQQNQKPTQHQQRQNQNQNQNNLSQIQPSTNTNKRVERERDSDASSKTTGNKKKAKALSDSSSDDETMNESDDDDYITKLDNTVAKANQETEYKEVISKKQRKQNKLIEKSASSNSSRDFQQTGRLPAIKIQIQYSSAKEFENPIALQKEIIKHKQIGVTKLQIKFASLTSNIITIATDDLATHSALSSEWPADAFKQGAKLFKKKEDNKPTKILIKGVHLDINITDDEINEQLETQGITNPERIFNNKKKMATTIIKASVANQKLAKAIVNKGVFIGFTRS